MTRTKIAAAALVALLAGTAIVSPTRLPFAQSQSPALGLQAQLPSLAPLVDKVRPAVVNISTTQRMERGERGGGGPDVPDMPFPMFPPGSPFSDMFRHFFESPGRGTTPAPARRVTSLGSGFLVDSAGYVVTNNHVVGKAEEITVTLQDSSQHKARLIGRDEKTDIALLKVDAGKPLPFVTFGDSEQAKVGDWVVAVGNPFGLGGSVTAGILSARGRDLQSGPFDDYLQIDAPINRGNSGGPSFNLSGDVIGINTAIYSPNGGSVGIGFAVPSNLAKKVVNELRDKGSVSRGWLGVQIQEVTGPIAESLGLDKPRGALVTDVSRKSPAEAAGLRQGDVVLEFGGQPIEKLRDLPRAVADARIGGSVKANVWRDGKQIAINVTVGGQRAETTASNDEQPGQVERGGQLGLALAALDGMSRQRFGLGDETKGVVVVGVKPGSAAAQHGLQPGDVIVSVAGEQVSKPDEVVSKVTEAQSAKRKSLLFLIERRGSSRFVALPLAAA
jgi:serine protease Do